ncbi:MAG: helix-hairpin-helix domain-containing protein [Bacteroidota bacterium]|nr:helix-hairpin-helix domain-containing protein [Bacteroidota bacterium]
MWKDYFSFSKSERNGIIVLLVIISILIATKWYLKNYSSPNTYDFSSFENEIIAFENSLQKTKPKKKNYYVNISKEKYDTLKLFQFNPNSCSSEDFKKLGLSTKQIDIIKNYREKGGRFYNAEDFRKIYGIPNWQSDILTDFISIPKNQNKYQNKTIDKPRQIEYFPFDPNIATKEELQKLGISDWISSNIVKYRNKGGGFYFKSDLLKIYGFDTLLYAEISEYIQLPDKVEITENKIDSVKFTNEKILIELNSTDTALLKSLPGIGAVFAQRIVKYRDLLGGYIDKKQLLEVFGMQVTRFEKIEGLVFIDKPVRKLSINFSGQNELRAHPYLNYDQARAIIKYRNKNGAFSSVDQLFAEGILDENSFEKVKPYLSVKIQ